MKKIMIVAMLAGLSLAASAKDEVTVGSLSGVKGNISIGGNGFVSKAVNGTPVANGNTVMVSTDGRATVVFKDGCSVSLDGGQHMKVDTKLSCGQQQAAVAQLFKPYRLAQAPVGSGGAAAGGGAGAAGATGLGIGLGIAGGIIAVGAVTVNNDDNKASGS